VVGRDPKVGALGRQTVPRHLRTYCQASATWSASILYVAGRVGCPCPCHVEIAAQVGILLFHWLIISGLLYTDLLSAL
jgi:hypothetical protein